MTPAARVQAAIDILDRWQGGTEGMDRVLTAWGRRNRYAGSGDRRAIGDLVYQGLRRLRSAAWTAGSDTQDGRAVMHGLALLEGEDPDALFSGDRHAPRPLSDCERSARRKLDSAPRAVRLDYPDWLESDLDGLDDAVLATMQDRAPLDLRANLLVTDPETALRALAEDGITAEGGPLSPTALRVVDGARRVQAGRAWRDGLVEIQDAASQAVADLAVARAGETILDLCAGGGGKSLALAAAAGPGGRVLSHDIDERRMTDLPARARRAGARIEIVPTRSLPDLAGRCDLVFVDAPCSGSGTWRRNPDAKWRLTPAQLDGFKAMQTQLLDQAGALCVSDGRILYATCSVFARENREQVDAFLDRHPDWKCRSVLSLLPGDGGDGLYGALLARV